MELKDFSVEPCKSRLAFEFLPKKPQELDLARIAKHLAEYGMEIDVQTTFLVMAHWNHHGISMFKSGKIIVKDAQNESEARKIAQTLIEKMGE